MKTRTADIAVIGGGAAGLTAAARCAAAGKKTLLIERLSRPGGVLQQCIHSGFGIHRFNEELTGPEYAHRVLTQAEEAGAEILLNATVMQIDGTGEVKTLTVYSRDEGVLLIRARAVILAMGCRERCRGNLGIPGERTAGIFNAGLAQKLINEQGLLPGTRAVIAGSGDIGLIMARRLSWCGVKVACVIEIMPYPAGLSRNIAQCLEDFDIPLLLSHTLTGIYGKKRVEYVTIAPLVNGVPDLAQEKKITCDTILFSVGLVPENELSRACGIELDPVTNGPRVDSSLMTNIPGIFSCGNVLHVHDLVDFVSDEADRAADSAVAWAAGERPGEAAITVKAGKNLRYTVPHRAEAGKTNHFYMRASTVMDKAELRVTSPEGRIIFSKKLRYVKPAEMISAAFPCPEESTYTFTLENC
ncbi:MAG: FAD-dependent oxidoreductase [Lentisphaeria bacterium]|nr:FAD-dependent oxidoreductase [Lentisphaeria bacterium]